MDIIELLKLFQPLNSAGTVILVNLHRLASTNYTSHNLRKEPFILKKPYQASTEQPPNEDDDDVEVDLANNDQAEKEGKNETASPPKKRRKKKISTNEPPPLNETVAAANNRHNQIYPRMTSALARWQEWYRGNPYDHIYNMASPSSAGLDQLPDSSNERNVEESNDHPDTQADDKAAEVTDFVAMCGMAHVPKFHWIVEHIPWPAGELIGMRMTKIRVGNDYLGEEEDNPDLEKGIDLFNLLITNHSNEDRTAKAGGCTVVIPPHCTFLLSDKRDRLQPLVDLINKSSHYNSTSSSGFNLIVMDPPWENKSAVRSSKYPTIPCRSLLQLPLRKLMDAKRGCLVAMWVTNRERVRRNIEEDLLPGWGLKVVASWHWLKVTCTGQPVCKLESAHRRPYETLLLCCDENLILPGGEINTANNEASNNSNVQHLSFLSKPIPDGLIMLGMPAQHSRKPQLGKMLLPYLNMQDARCLELFARELTTGWTSWGNECLKFQTMENFE